MFYRAIARGQPFAGFFWFVIERSHPAAIGDMAALINDVNALGPCSVSVIGCVAHVIDPKGQREFESLREIIRDGHALLQRFRLRVADIVLHVGFHLPFVGGMRLANVHGQKIRVVLIIFINLNDVAHLAAKWRSSKTSEHQYQRPLMSSFADVEAANAVQRHDSRVGRIAAHFQRAAMHVRQGVPHHAVHVLWATCHIGEHGKSSNEQHAKNARDPFPETIHSLFLPHMNLYS